MKLVLIFLIGLSVAVFAAPSLQAQTCDYVPGDINGNGSVNGIDLVYAVAYMKGGAPPPIDCNPPCTGQPDPFFAAGDVNGDCRFNGIDIVWWIYHAPVFRFCPDCPPAGVPDIRPAPVSNKPE